MLAVRFLFLPLSLPACLFPSLCRCFSPPSSFSPSPFTLISLLFFPSSSLPPFSVTFPNSVRSGCLSPTTFPGDSLMVTECGHTGPCGQTLSVFCPNPSYQSSWETLLNTMIYSTLVCSCNRHIFGQISKAIAVFLLIYCFANKKNLKKFRKVQ